MLPRLAVMCLNALSAVSHYAYVCDVGTVNSAVPFGTFVCQALFGTLVYPDRDCLVRLFPRCVWFGGRSTTVSSSALWACALARKAHFHCHRYIT